MFPKWCDLFNRYNISNIYKILKYYSFYSPPAPLLRVNVLNMYDNYLLIRLASRLLWWFTLLNMSKISLIIRYFIIDQQIAWHFVHFSECLSNLLPFYATQIINSFLNSRISADHDKGLEFKPIVKSLYSLMFLY